MDSFEMLLRASGVAEEMDISAAEEKEEFDAIRGILSLAGKVTMDDIESFNPSAQSLGYRRPRAMSEPWSYDEFHIWPTPIIKPNDMGAYEDSVLDKDEELQQEEINVRKEYADIYNKNGRIGIYTKEERSLIIQRYRDKKNRRNWKKQVRYSCRKDLADRRIRIKGRFIKAEDMEKLGLSLDGKVLGDAEEVLSNARVPLHPSGSERSERDGLAQGSSNPLKTKSGLTEILQTMQEDGELIRPGKRIRRHSIAY